ncbi:adenosine deaminase [Rubrimonas cliftonensis]|uniref:Adenosine deaminase n=1 Tax=Rubrimonas cliftonensis TaxID=89524 RepID=A0A1H4AK76_9RHOB|nr:adenosine deaminase [Rubrimonas cliftonensis]SEA36310.1 adenosine deaminase [Rubrimonas cliftonensis]
MAEARGRAGASDAAQAHTAWAAVPKIELHLHLEGAAPVALTQARMARAGLAAAPLDEAGGYGWDGFSAFLAAYDRVADLYAAPEGARALAEAVLTQCAAHGVIYAELIMAPLDAGAAHGPDAGAWAERLAAVEEGADAAETACGVVCRLLPHVVRSYGPEACARTAKMIAGVRTPRVVGFGIAGDERVGRPADFSRAFAIARDAGLRLAAHAGEFGGPESVRGAVADLGVDRVAHGARAIEDPSLVALLAERRTPLDVCPGSNVALGVYPGWAAHPAPALRAAGCVVTLSTDDPPFFGTTMSREYAEAAAAWGWGEADFAAIARDSLDAAFCDAATRARLSARLPA